MYAANVPNSLLTLFIFVLGVHEKREDFIAQSVLHAGVRRTVVSIVIKH